MKITTRTWVSALTLAATLSFPTGRAEDAPKPAPPAPSSETRKRPERPAGDRQEAMREQRDAWVKELGATEEQMGKIREAMKAQAEKGRALREDTTLSQEDRRAKMKEIRDGMTAKMKEILNADQFAKYEKLMEQRQMGRGEGRRPGPRPDAPKPSGAPSDSSK